MKRAKKAIAKFRKQCSDRQVLVRFIKKRENRWTISLKKDKYETSIYVDKSDDESFGFHFPEKLNTLSPDLDILCLKFVKEVGAEIDSPCLWICMSNPWTGNFHGFQPADDSLRSAMFNSYVVGDFYYYFNNIEHYVERKAALKEAVQTQTAALTLLKPTRSFTIRASYGSVLRYQYYFEGMNGEFEIDYKTYTFSDGDFLKTFDEIRNLAEVLECHTQWLIQKTRLKNVYDPPKKHLYLFFRHLTHSKEKADQVFSHLSTLLPHTDLEEKFATHAPLHLLKINEEASIANICGHWFSFLSLTVHVHSSFEEALCSSQRHAKQLAAEKYQFELQDIEEKVSKLIQIQY